MTIFEMRLTEASLEIILELHLYFCDESDPYKKIVKWLITRNLPLGGTTPLMMMNTGRAHKVLELIKKGDIECK